jgi:hypothetical protein
MIFVMHVIYHVITNRCRKSFSVRYSEAPLLTHAHARIQHLVEAERGEREVNLAQQRLVTEEEMRQHLCALSFTDDWAIAVTLQHAPTSREAFRNHSKGLFDEVSAKWCSGSMCDAAEVCMQGLSTLVKNLWLD